MLSPSLDGSSSSQKSFLRDQLICTGRRANSSREQHTYCICKSAIEHIDVRMSSCSLLLASAPVAATI